ncbi:trichodiene synthase [Akanthomyces lecanii RCEF 1005]|uniref:Trichodiene synthase n=1 Tax=Akanthomyces lecanii RCEF 1005 TaxID=1081108 RepID=A0A168HLQ6_CORDF|nr:trichodiene synthase [Akanthomyces lecanii RCEF 1005]
MQEFPVDNFLGAAVRLLEYIEYQDSNYSREERIENLCYAYEKAAHHFAQERQQTLLKADPKRLQASLQTIVGMVVYSWTKVSKELMADLSIHYTYTLVLDDSRDDPHPQMLTYFDDLQSGREQKHPWWILVNEHFPNVLRHFGPFCSLNLIRSTLDFFEGCWIEQYNFPGYHGSFDYPGFLRRINGLGHCVGASLWPKDQFDEQVLFREITSAVAQMENWMVWVNDLLSFYKEYDDPRDQTSLVKNYVTTYGITLGEALEKLIEDTLLSSKQMMAVFADKDPQLKETITRFMHGYVTWHLCDNRYRLKEIYLRAKTMDTEDARAFTRFREQAAKVGAVEASEWVKFTVVDAVEAQKAAKKHKCLSGGKVAPQCLFSRFALSWWQNGLVLCGIVLLLTSMHLPLPLLFGTSASRGHWHDISNNISNTLSSLRITANP